MLNPIVLAAGEAGAAPQVKTVQEVPAPQQGQQHQQHQQAQPQGSPWSLLVPILIVLVVMTFLSGRSQRKQREKQQKMFASIVKGTKLRTIGGFTGKVVEVREETLLIELADKMPPVEILKTGVAVVLDEAKTEEVKK